MYVAFFRTRFWQLNTFIHIAHPFSCTFRWNFQESQVLLESICIKSRVVNWFNRRWDMHDAFFRNLFWQLYTFIHIAHPFSRAFRWNFQVLQQWPRRIRSKCRVVNWLSGRWDMMFIVLFNRNFSVSHKFTYLPYLNSIFHRTSSIWSWVYVAPFAKQIISIGCVQQELCVTVGSDDFVLLFSLASTF